MALVPDLHRAELAAHNEMDRAAHLVQSLPPERAARDMSGAVDYLVGHKAVTGDGIGVVGFGMGKDVTFTIHRGAGHAFMDPLNALGTSDEELSARLWPELVSFLHDKLG